MPDFSDSERRRLRDSVPKKLRFSRAESYVSISRIAEKWCVTRNHASKLILEKYGMSRINISSLDQKKRFRIDVDDYYLATLERIENGTLTNPDDPEDGLFGDTNQFNSDRDDAIEI